MTSPEALAVLRRIRSGPPAAAPGERCEMCGAPIPADEQTLLPRAGGAGRAHAHVVDVGQRRLMCTCRPCALLFTDDGAALLYRTVPDRYLALPTLDADWDTLDVPVGLAFFFVNSTLGRTVGCYPSPAGATESQLPLASWNDLVEANPVLRDLKPDVEALLVRTHAGPGSAGEATRAATGTPRASVTAATDTYLVPIDACYALVGRLRQLWRGFDGGSEVRDLLAAFFADLAAVSRPARRAEPSR